MEIWKDIDGYEGLYQVSNLGRVKSLCPFWNSKIKMEKILRQQMSSKGYMSVMLAKNGKQKRVRVHRLVAAAFILNDMNKDQVNHIDGDKTNNKSDNLEWCTQSENIKHAFLTGLKENHNHQNNKLSVSVAQYDKDMRLVHVFPSMNEAQRCGFSCPEICKCCKGKQRTHKGYIWKYA